MASEKIKGVAKTKSSPQTIALHKTAANGTVPAYQAKDGSLHLNKNARDLIDARAEYDRTLAVVSEQIFEHAPEVDDWRCAAFSDAQQISLALDDVIESSHFVKLLEARAVLHKYLEIERLEKAAQKANG